MNKKQLIFGVISPVVKEFFNSDDEQNLSIITLLAGTAGVESNYGEYIAQIGGPALGIFQMEPGTHKDIWTNYLKFRPSLKQKIWEEIFYCKNPTQDMPSVRELALNHAYSTVLARIHYMRVPEKLPDRNSAHALAAYHKKYYNTELGKTDPAKSVKIFSEVIEIMKK